MRYSYPTIFALLALCVLPLTMWLEKEESRTWQGRLAFPDFTEEPNRHTPLFPLAAYLPSEITTDTVVGKEGEPVAITEVVTIRPGATLTVQPGSIVAFHEHGQLVVDGILQVLGTSNNRVQFVSNEVHSENKAWEGIQINAGGKAVLQNVLLEHGNPAIACLPNSTAVIENLVIRLGNVGLYTESTDCSIRNSTIEGALRSVVARGVAPDLSTVKIIASQAPLLVSNN